MSTSSMKDRLQGALDMACGMPSPRDKAVSARTIQLTFKDREDAWCRATGLRRSTARSRAVVSFMRDHESLAGFDHTHVYYWPPGRLYVLLTEPYHSTEDALRSVKMTARKAGKTFSYASGYAARGLWYPGACIPLLIARPGTCAVLKGFLALMPKAACDAS